MRELGCTRAADDVIPAWKCRHAPQRMYHVMWREPSRDLYPAATCLMLFRESDQHRHVKSRNRLAVIDNCLYWVPIGLQYILRRRRRCVVQGRLLTIKCVRWMVGKLYHLDAISHLERVQWSLHPSLQSGSIVFEVRADASSIVTHRNSDR